MNPAAKTWSAPYYGVQHLEGVKRGYQFTVEDRGAWAESLAFLPGRGFSADRMAHKNVALARSHAEHVAKAMDAFDGEQAC